MNTDDDLQHLFRSSAPDVDLAVDRVVAGGTARGRRLRRRQNATALVGGLATIAVVAPLAWLGASALGGGTEGTVPAASGPSTSVAPAADPAAPRVPAFDDAGMATQVRQILGQMAPGLEITEITDGNLDRSGNIASAVVRDASGEGTVEVQVWPNDGTDVATQVDDFCGAESDTDATCSEVEGGTLAVEASTWKNDAGETYYDHVVDLVTDDGLRVRAISSNNVGVAVETLAPERPEAPLTLGQTIEIATDPRWVVEGELPPPPVQVPIRELSVRTVDEARARLTALVREVLPDAEVTPTTANPSGMDLSAAVLVDDGNGPSYVEVALLSSRSDFNYHSWLDGQPRCGDGCVEDERGYLTTLRDDNDGKAGSTGVFNMASLQRADSPFISVSSSNTPVSQFVATSTSRTAPLLSTKQLAKIARSSSWVE